MNSNPIDFDDDEEDDPLDFYEYSDGYPDDEDDEDDEYDGPDSYPDEYELNDDGTVGWDDETAAR